MSTNVSTDAALKEASAMAAHRREAKKAAAKRLYENGLPLKTGARSIGLDETTIRKWAAEYEWKRGVPG
jgi:uncharacterized protein YjcR